MTSAARKKRPLAREKKTATALDNLEPVAEFRVIDLGEVRLQGRASPAWRFCQIGDVWRRGGLRQDGAACARFCKDKFSGQIGHSIVMSGAFTGSGTESSPAGEWDDEDEAGAENSPLVVEAVGRALQRHFQAIADMPLPDRLLVLLAELEARERSS